MPKNCYSGLCTHYDWITNQAKLGLIPIEELRGAYTPQLIEFLESLGELAAKFNLVEIVTATNHNAERDKWLEAAEQGDFITPTFQYNDELLRNVAEHRDVIQERFVPALQAMKPTNQAEEVLHSLATERMLNVATIIDVANCILLKQARHANWKLAQTFTKPHHDVLQLALSLVEKRQNGQPLIESEARISPEEQYRLAAIHLDAEAIARVFRWAADEYGFGKTRPVVVSETATAVDVRDTSSEGPIVVIPADQMADGLSILALTMHEVGCHWRDSENMQELLPLMGAGALKPVDELIYEGHAVWQDQNIKLATRGYVKPTRSVYYPLAMGYAKQTRSFARTAELLYDDIRSDFEPTIVTLRDVWRVTYRVFRGHPCPADRAAEYVFPKDYAYLGGRVLAESMCEHGMEHIMEYGTLSAKDITILSQDVDLRPQQAMPYPRRDDIITTLRQKLLRGEFVSN